MEAPLTRAEIKRRIEAGRARKHNVSFLEELLANLEAKDLPCEEPSDEPGVYETPDGMILGTAPPRARDLEKARERRARRDRGD